MSDPKDIAQATLDSCGIEPGQVYRHYKGGLYSIVALAIEEQTMVPLVVYRSNKDGTTWVRPLDDFTCRIEYGGCHVTTRFLRETD